MDYKHLENGRETVLTGTPNEFWLLEQGVHAALSIADTAAAREDGTWPGTDYLHDLERKLPQFNEAEPSAELLGITVDVDELTALCHGLRVARNHAELSVAILGGSPGKTGKTLERQATAYGNLREELLPGVRYQERLA